MSHVDCVLKTDIQSTHNLKVLDFSVKNFHTKIMILGYEDPCTTDTDISYYI